MSITANTLVEVCPAGSAGTIPKDPYNFGRTIQYSQPNRTKLQGDHRILFNKGRYFETSIYSPDTLQQLCALTGFQPKHGNMICQNWRDMEDFVIAMNILGYYVDIDIDWI